MSDTNFDHIASLFAIIEGCVGHTGKFGAIQNEAFNELNEINENLHKRQLDKKASDERKVQAEQAQGKAPSVDPGHEPTEVMGEPEVDEDQFTNEDTPVVTQTNTTIADRRL